MLAVLCYACLGLWRSETCFGVWGVRLSSGEGTAEKMVKACVLFRAVKVFVSVLFRFLLFDSWVLETEQTQLVLLLGPSYRYCYMSSSTLIWD